MLTPTDILSLVKRKRCSVSLRAFAVSQCGFGCSQSQDITSSMRSCGHSFTMHVSRSVM